MALTLEPHPARIWMRQTEAELSGRTIFERKEFANERDEMIPFCLVEAFPDDRQIMMDGIRVGYCKAKPNKPICFIRDLDDVVLERVKEFVEAEVGKVSHIAKAARPPEVKAQDTDLDPDAPDDEDD